MKNFTVRMLTRTALLLALCVGVQQFKNLSQFITGPLVNAILIIAALYVGFLGGAAVAILSPVFALLIAPSPILQAIPQMVILIAAGNLVIVLLSWLFRRRLLPAGLIVGSGLKTLALWGGVQLVILPMFGGALKPPQVTALSAAFSVNQLITALIGSALAWLVWQRLKKTRDAQIMA